MTNTSLEDTFNLNSLFYEAYRRAYHGSGLLLGLLCLWICLKQLFEINPLGGYLPAFIWLFASLFLVATWAWFRRIPRFSSETIGILIAPHGDSELRKELDNLKTEIASKLRSSKLSGHFSIKYLPENRTIQDVETARSIRQKSNCLLLIWGDYEKGRIHGKEFRGFPVGKLNFTYAYPKTLPEGESQSDINKGIQNRTWLFASENELIERDFLISNIVDVARYIIGTNLLLFGRTDAGKEFLLDILRNPTGGRWHGRAVRTAVDFIANLKAKLARADCDLAQGIYRSRVFVGGHIMKDATALSEILKLTEASLNNRPTANAYLLRAIVYFLQNKIPQAQHLLIRIHREESSNSAPIYSLAFLYAYEGDIERSERRYSQAFERSQNMEPDQIFHLVEFASAVLELEPGRFGLHYALGLLHKELVDGTLARQHFLRFIAQAPPNKEWEQHAQTHIAEIGAQGKSPPP